MIKALKFILLFYISFTSLNTYAGEIVTNARLEGSALTATGAGLMVRYDKYINLPYPSVNPFATINPSKGMIEFGIDETKKIFHATGFTSVLTVTYTTKDFSLASSGPLTQTIQINYAPAGDYTGQGIFKIDNIASLEITGISVTSSVTGGGSITNPADLYLETSITTDETLSFDFTTALPATARIGYDTIPIATPNPTDLQVWWDYVQGAEEYEMEYIYIDDYYNNTTSLNYADRRNTASIDYNFDHDATRIITHNQYYRIPLVYEKGWIIFRVRGVGHSQVNNNVRLEGAWSNPGFITATHLSDFISSFPNQSFRISTAHEDDGINWSSSRSFSENGKSGIGVAYSDGLLKSRQSVSKLNTEDKTIVQSSLYDWQGRPAISVLPTPVNDNYLSYKKDLNKTITGIQFDKNVFDNAANFTDPCLPQGLRIDSTASNGAAKYYSSLNNTGQEAQQALIPDAFGFPYVQVDYYPDQTGRVKRQSMPGKIHFLGSGKESQFFYVQPTQEELVRLFGTEVGVYDEYEKQVSIDANGQTSVSYTDNSGRTIATGLMGEAPANLLAISDATDPATAQTLTTTINNNDSTQYVIGLTNTFYAAQGEVEQISYNVTLSQYTDECLPDICMDCIYDLEISITDDCGNELLDGDPVTTGNQPIIQTLGRYNPGAVPEFPVTCGDVSALHFTLSPNPFTFTAPKNGTYHLSKVLTLSNKPLAEYAQDYIKQDTCIESLSHFQQSNLADIDFSGCGMLDCAQCTTAVNTFVAGLPEGTLTTAQINTLLDKCQVTCNLEQNICQAKEMLVLKDFKPGGYFGSYNTTGIPDFTETANTLSIFNPANTIQTTILGSASIPVKWYAVPPASYGSYTTTDPLTGAVVTPDQLSIGDYIGTHNDNYAEPWLIWHPEYCRLKFNCDDAINALNAYTSALEDINSFDDACRLGYLFAVPSATVLSNAPDATTCPTCSGITNHYLPLVGYSGTTYLTTSQINAAISSVTAAITSQTFHDDAGHTVSADIYQYAVSIGNMTDLSTIGSTLFGSGCNKDKQWLFYKRLYLNYVNTMINNLQISFISGWSNLDGGCLTNFTSLPGYVRIFPDPSLTSTGALSGFGSGATTSSAGAASAGSAFTAQCADYCHAYANAWMTTLQNSTTCSVSHADSAVVEAALEAVCNGGCDASNPYGASTSATAVVITVSGMPVTVHSFQEVLTAFGYNFTPACNAYLITAPGPQGTSYSGAAVTNPGLDACGCDAILSAHNSYTAGVAGSTINSCLISEADYVKQQLNVTLPYLSSYVCACNSAKIDDGYDFSVVDSQLLLTLPLPEQLACKHCIPCSTLTTIKSNLNKQFGDTPFSSIDHTVLTNFFNQESGMNNTYDEWIQFNRDCQNNIVNGGFNGQNGLTFLTTDEALDFKKLFAALAVDNFLAANTLTTLYTLNNADAPGYFSSLLLPPSFAAGTVSVQITYNGGQDQLYISTTYSTSSICNYTLNMPSGQVFPDFTTVNTISFFDLKGACNSVNNGSCKDFVMTLSYVDNATGTAHTYTLTGTNSCYVTLDQPHIALPGNTTCQPYLCSHSLSSEPLPPNNCLTTLVNNALNTAQTQYNTYMAEQVDLFLANYKDYCSRHITETTKRIYTLKEYNYTLYYYDRAGNLVHTVPPAGVSVITNAVTITNAVNYVQAVTGSVIYPTHSLNSSATTIASYISHNQYNTFDAPTTQVTPDGGETTYYYDMTGRLVVSQTSKQAGEGTYSYILYDNLGRTIEVGVFELNVAGGEVFDSAVLKDQGAWATYINLHARHEVTQTYYDYILNTTTDAQFPNGQQNLRNRVSATTYEWFYDNDQNTYDYGTFFSYDDHGHAEHIIQHNPQLNSYGLANEYKHIEYEYELVSNNVKKVIYQRGLADQWFHKYEYDSDNRLHIVYTSNNDLVYQRDAKHFYYQHGPIARIELGEKEVQGTDYAYTILGWVKGINSTTLNEDTDIGKDGANGNAYMSAYADLHKDFAKDAASYSLNYFTGDYNAIKSTAQNFLADMTNLNAVGATGFKLSTNAPDLYNGNISSMVTSIYDITPLDIDQGKVKPQITGYQYDQLQRLKNMKAYSSLQIASGTQHSEAIDLSTNSWITPSNGVNYVDLYKMYISYDKLGNIQSLNRLGDGQYSGGFWNAKAMDKLAYTYASAPIYITSLGRDYIVNSRLTSVADDPSIPTTNYNDDMDGIHNYDYNAIGSLTKDASEEIDNIEWTDSRKIKTITRISGSTKPDLSFTYDGFGHRISKTILAKTTLGAIDPANTKTIHYVLDATGNDIAIYEELKIVPDLKCLSHTIFGSGRLGLENTEIDMLAGTATPTIPIVFGKKEYELNNHLDNVISTISDRKIQETGTDVNANGLADYYTSDIINTNDYYAYGQTMPGKTNNIGGAKYRYGFNGKEKDDEMKGNDNSYDFGARIYDPRMGRFMSTDPAHSGFSFQTPYSFAGNTPIQAIDQEGEKIYFVSVNGTFVDAEKTLIKTAAGREIIARYEASTTHDIYISVVNIPRNENGASSDLGLTVSDASSYISNSKIKGLGDAYRNAGYLEAATAYDSFEGLDVSKSKGRQISLIALSSLDFTENSEYDKYMLAEIIFHEITAHISIYESYKKIFNDAGITGQDEVDAEHFYYGTSTAGLSKPRKDDNSTPYYTIYTQLNKLKQAEESIKTQIPYSPYYKLPESVKDNNHTNSNSVVHELNIHKKNTVNKKSSNKKSGKTTGGYHKQSKHNARRTRSKY